MIHDGSDWDLLILLDKPKVTFNDYDVGYPFRELGWDIGDLEGTQQSGIPFDLHIANLARDGQVVQMARDVARRVLDSDPTYNRPEHTVMWQALSELTKRSVDWSAIS